GPARVAGPHCAPRRGPPDHASWRPHGRGRRYTLVSLTAGRSGDCPLARHKLMSLNSFKTRQTLTVGTETLDYFSLPALEAAGFPGVARLPFSIKILLENLLRREDDAFVKAEDIRTLASWDMRVGGEKELSFMPARVLLQDFTGVPCVVDLAAMRDG